MPLLAMLRARFIPIVARPITPNRLAPAAPRCHPATAVCVPRVSRAIAVSLPVPLRLQCRLHLAGDDRVLARLDAQYLWTGAGRAQDGVFSHFAVPDRLHAQYRQPGYDRGSG